MESSKKIQSFAMERMKAKDEEDRMEKMNTKQRRGTPTRDMCLQKKVLHWIMDMLDEKPRGKTDFDHWLSDGAILVKVLQCIMFNSVPMDALDNKDSKANSEFHPNNFKNEKPKAKDEALIRKMNEDRIRLLLKYLRKYGVPEKYLFDPDELIEMRNMPKITRCVAMLAKMSGSTSFSECSIDIPEVEILYYSSDDE